MPILILSIATSTLASIDFKKDWLTKPDDMPYGFIGFEDTNKDGYRDEVYYKDGDKEYLMLDTNYDKKIDAIIYYENEILIKKEKICL